MQVILEWVCREIQQWQKLSHGQVYLSSLPSPQHCSEFSAQDPAVGSTFEEQCWLNLNQVALPASKALALSETLALSTALFISALDL